MAELLLGNVEASDEEIRDFLGRYGFPPFDAIEHIPGDGTRPLVRLTYNGISFEVLRRMQPKIQDKFWKNRRINAQVMTHSE